MVCLVYGMICMMCLRQRQPYRPGNQSRHAFAIRSGFSTPSALLAPSIIIGLWNEYHDAKMQCHVHMCWPCYFMVQVHQKRQLATLSMTFAATRQYIYVCM